MASARVKTAGETVVLVAGYRDLYQWSLLSNFVSYRIAMLDKSCMRDFSVDVTTNLVEPII